MIGCLFRTAMLVVVLVLAAIGWWWWKGGRTPLPRDIDLRSPIVFGEDSMSTAPSPALERADWHPFTASPAATDSTVPSRDEAAGRTTRTANGASDSLQQKLRQLSRPDGPAMVTFTPTEVSGFLTDAVARQLPRSARGMAIAVVDSMVYVRAEVLLREVGMEKVLGELAGFLDQRDTVIVGSTFELVERGLGQLTVREIIVGQISLPRPLVSRVVALNQRRRSQDGRVAPGAYPVRVPRYVGDVRFQRGRMTLYRGDT